MAIRWDKFTVKSQEAMQQAQAHAAELGNPDLQPVHRRTAPSAVLPRSEAT